MFIFKIGDVDREESLLEQSLQNYNISFKHVNTSQLASSAGPPPWGSQISGASNIYPQVCTRVHKPSAGYYVVPQSLLRIAEVQDFSIPDINWPYNYSLPNISNIYLYNGSLPNISIQLDNNTLTNILSYLKYNRSFSNYTFQGNETIANILWYLNGSLMNSSLLDNNTLAIMSFYLKLNGSLSNTNWWYNGSLVSVNLPYNSSLPNFNFSGLEADHFGMGMEMNIGYNTTAVHSLPIAVNILSNTLLYQKVKSAGIMGVSPLIEVTANQLPFNTRSEFYSGLIRNGITQVLASPFVLIAALACLIVLAFAGAEVVSDREVYPQIFKGFFGK